MTRTCRLTVLGSLQMKGRQRMRSVRLGIRQTWAICVEEWFWYLDFAREAYIRAHLSQTPPAPAALAGLVKPCRVSSLKEDGKVHKARCRKNMVLKARLKDRLACEGERITKTRNNGSLRSLRRCDRHVVPPYLVVGQVRQIR